MNEIVKQEPRAQLTAGKSVSGLIPQNIEEAFRVATAVSKAGMAPYGMDTPEKCLIAVMSGAEVGLPPMQSIQNIAVINNRPCMWGDAVIGVVRASGFCKYVKEWIEGEGNDMVAYCETQRIDEKSPVTEAFSVKDAIKAGLWQTEPKVQRRAKGGGTYEADNDSPWYKHPKRMLKMRARAFCLRDTYADVLKGLQVREEVEDYQIIDPEPIKQIAPSEMANRYSKPAIENKTQKNDGFNSSGIDNEIENISKKPSQDTSTEPFVENSASADVGEVAGGETHQTTEPSETPKDTKQVVLSAPSDSLGASVKLTLLEYAENLVDVIGGADVSLSQTDVIELGKPIRGALVEYIEEGDMALCATEIWDTFFAACNCEFIIDDVLIAFREKYGESK